MFTQIGFQSQISNYRKLMSYNQYLIHFAQDGGEKKLHVLSTLLECYFTIAIFHLWMSKSEHDIIAFVISFLQANW